MPDIEAAKQIMWSVAARHKEGEDAYAVRDELLSVKKKPAASCAAACAAACPAACAATSSSSTPTPPNNEFKYMIPDMTGLFEEASRFRG
eukprot:3022816-Lingulodinium_polyedra.AAC.1